MIPGLTTKKTSAAKKKPSSVRHTRAIQRDRTKRPPVAPSAPQVEAHLTDLIQPATVAQVARFQARGLRERILTLPVMVAFVRSLIWRHLGSVAEATRGLRQEGVLGVQPTQVSAHALTDRLGSLPASLFHQVCHALLPHLQQRWQARRRPIPPAVAWAQRHFPAVLALAGSTVDALLHKPGLLQGCATRALAGRRAALLDLAPRLPRQVWYEEDRQAHDQRCGDRVIATVAAGTLLIVDLGVLNAAHDDALRARGIHFRTRAAENMAYRVERVLQATGEGHDLRVWGGSTDDSRCRHRRRLVEIRPGATGYRYLTHAVAPVLLPAPYVLGL